MAQKILDKSARIVIVEPSMSLRMAVSEALTGLGFKSITGQPSLKDVISYISREPVDWVISYLQADDAVNILSFLAACQAKPELVHLSVSLFSEALGADGVISEPDVRVRKAFEMGLLSCHQKPYTQESIQKDFSKLIDGMQKDHGKTSITAFRYLKDFLFAEKDYRKAHHILLRLLDLFPGSNSLLLFLADIQFALGQRDVAFTTLRQAEFLDESRSAEVNAIRTRFKAAGGPEPADVYQNVLGIKLCVVIDPDSVVLNLVVSYLTSLGVPEVKTFENGQAAFDWCSQNPEPDLIIQEWRIPGLNGMLLLQRLRGIGFNRAAIIVMSSLVKKSEYTLVREMGVANVVSKPVDRNEFLQTLVWTLQQMQVPTERRMLEQKIRLLIHQNNFEEAANFHSLYMNDPDVPRGAKKQMEAEWFFAKGAFKKAAGLAAEAIKHAGDSLFLLNLLGKCLLKTGDFESALRCLEKAQTMSPLNIERLCCIAEVESDLNKGADAQNHINEANALDAGNEKVKQTEISVAISLGNENKARQLMGKLESLPKIVSYMNNRAVAFARCGKFDDGISLYQKTIGSLPDEWSTLHDAVSYNLGLAYARHGNLKEALDALGQSPIPQDDRLRRKRNSLLHRVREAVSSNYNLVFQDEKREGLEFDGENLNSEEKQTPPSQEQSAKSVAEILERDGVPAGMRALWNIYADDIKDSQIAKMLQYEIKDFKVAAQALPALT